MLCGVSRSRTIILASTGMRSMMVEEAASVPLLKGGALRLLPASGAVTVESLVSKTGLF